MISNNRFQTIMLPYVRVYEEAALWWCVLSPQLTNTELVVAMSECEHESYWCVWLLSTTGSGEQHRHPTIAGNDWTRKRERERVKQIMDNGGG